MKSLIRLLRTTFDSWSEDRAPKMAAALAYYAAFAMAPTLLIAIAVAGLVFGPDAARGAVAREVEGLIGRESAETLQGVIERAWNPKAGLIATIVGVLTLLVAATGAFGELQDSLNQIWKVKKKPGRGILGTLKDRFFSFTMVLSLGFLLLVSLVATAAVEAVADYVTGPGGGILLRGINLVLSLGIITLLFAAIFKYVPDARTRWRDAWMGATLTALLFTLGKYLIGVYLGTSTIGTTYGAAASFLVILLWVNYSAQILFLGAEFTKAWADRQGRAPKPDRDAVTVQCGAGDERRKTA